MSWPPLALFVVDCPAVAGLVRTDYIFPPAPRLDVFAGFLLRSEMVETVQHFVIGVYASHSVTSCNV